MTMSHAWYVTCSDCARPAEVSVVGSDDALRIAANEGFIRVRRDGRIADLCREHAAGWTGKKIGAPRGPHADLPTVSVREARVRHPSGEPWPST